ncbi:MAG: DUF438 domain-containing protein [Eubacteriales bacterium]|nr:DUF438 domain-containing protein [Eubacteriales bacterium]
MAKQIDLNKTVYELTKAYPELIDIMVDLGLTEVAKPAMLHSVGKIMTLPKGAKMKNIPMLDVVIALQAKGFQLVGEMPDLGAKDKAKGQVENASAANEVTQNDGSKNATEDQALKEHKQRKSEVNNRKEQLKALLRRLSEGEDLEVVRKDFVRDFEAVDALEIMEAEQEMIKEGTPLEEVQRLCDLHSALFHGATKEEQIAQAEQAVEESLRRQQTVEADSVRHKQVAVKEQVREKQEQVRENQVAVEESVRQKQIKDVMAKQASFRPVDGTNREARAQALAEIPGHPLSTFTKENEALAKLLSEFASTKNEELLPDIREVAIHYAKKGDLIYPHLKVQYGVTGPSDVMWTVDDEIRDELSELSRKTEHNQEWQDRLAAVLQRVEEMIYKEKNILYPLCAVYFTEEDWQGIYHDAKDYATCLGVEPEVWPEAETKVKAKTAANKEEKPLELIDEIVLPGGHFTLEQLTALLDTIPLEITFVDADDINRFFNDVPKVFKRPSMAIDRNVYSCHPPKIEPLVRQIIEDFRHGRRDQVPVWMEKGGRTMFVNYMAVRDKQGKYLGTLEIVQDMEFAKEHFLG